MQAAFPLTKNDRIPQKYSISFDASVWEIFGPLLFGARLVLAEPGEHLDIDRLIDLFTTHQVTVLDVVPSMLNVLMEDERFLACRSLRRVTCGGETLPVKLQRSFFEHMTAELNNVYGPTEATIGATAWTCKPGYSDDNVPIGRPIANASIFVLDRYLNVVPIGVPGEIHIGGVCLARGYKNRPELDGEKFIANPFSKQSGAQLYKTGDVGRYLEDGTIQYLGRTDDQIKIRGFRVELGEIEVALGKHPSVEACSVSVREDQLGHAQLVAYIAPKTDNPELWPSVGEYFVYDDLLYYAMTHDERRNRAYRNAIECAVSGKTVLDIGTGADAIWARACVAAGAKRVYAIEMLDEAYTKALGLLTQLGLHDKIVLIHGDSTQVTLPELVDVCVSELLGTIGSSEGVVPILNDARRFLKNDGIMSPQRCVTKIAAVSLPEPLASQPRFSEGPAHYVEEVFKKVGRPFDLRLCIKYLPNKSIVSEAATFEDLNFLQQTPAEDVTNMTLTVTRDCRVDGFLCWLNLYPAEDELVDTLDGQSSWLPVLLPVFAPGLILETGDRIEMSCARISAAAGLVTPDYQLKGHVVRNSGAKTEFYYDAFSRPSYFRKTSFYDSLFKNSVIEEASLDTFESTSEHIFGWKKTYEDVYGRNLGESSQPELIGSNITCSGTPIPSDDIREQVRHTVSRILDLQPRRILDIGCGTGSLLFRMAPVSEYYVGTDIAPTALKYLSQELTARGLSNVSLLERSADNFDGLETGNFDTVVLNSVVQHFPDVDYFVRILQQAIELVCPAGFIFIGGLRNMSLLRAFHTSVELKRTAPFEPVRDVLERIRTRVNEERELLIEPLLFSGLRNNVRKIQRIEMQVKRGWQHNAMTEFCYDVVLQVGGDPDHQASFEKFDWEEISTVARLQHILAERNPETAVVQNVPSARLRREHDALKLFASADCPADMEQVLHLLSRKPHTAIEPEALWRISEELPYEVKVRWSGSGRESFYDVLLQRRSSTGQSRINDFLFADGGGAAWHRYANHPLRGDSRRALVPELRDFLKNRLPAHMVPAAFVVMQKLPVTPAGKIDRKALPAPDQSRPELAPSYERPRNEIEEALAGLWSQLLGVDRVGIHDNFFELGGDSILSIQLVARASRIGIHLSPAQLFQFQTVAELAKVAAKTGGVQAEQGLIKGNAPLLPIQKWLFEQNLPNVNHYNQSVLMCVPKALRADEVETVLNRLLMQHDALRLRFVCDESGWQQIFGELAIAVPVKHVDLTQLAMAEQMEALENECSKLQASFDLAVGPPICAALFNLGDSKSNRLFIAAHHLVIDGVSWRILLEDFEIAYEQLTGPQNIQLPAKTTSFQYWAQRLTEYANSAPLQAELSYWLGVPPSNPPKILTDHNTGQNNIASMRSVVISLTAEETERLLVDVPKAYHTQINDVLLTALAQVFERWTGEPQLFIDLEGHGREGIFENVDLSRTVGWFTTIFPVFLDLREAFSAEETLKSVKEQLRSIPNRGIGYGLLRYLCQYDETTRKLAALPRPEISFNYLGQFGGEEEDSEWRAASEATGPSLGLQQSRPYLFELNAAVYDGHFQVDWAYSENVHRRATIETLASDFKTGLSSLIDHCVSRNIRTYTPSDFSKAKLSQRDLDTLLSKLQRLAEA
jgi:non-ribosomal peptide synthase protein (TIGR01720 family)